MNSQTPTGYAYVRFSTSRQGGNEKDSVTRQKESIRILAEQHRVEIPDENFFYENGVSAFTGKNRTHGKLKDLIDQIDSLHIRAGDYVFVESIDRLSRQRLLQAKELVNGILEKGIVLVTTIDNQRYEKASEKNGIDDLSQDILLSVIAKRAHEESKTKSVRRKSAWSKAKNSAHETQKIFNKKRPPFGVQYNEVTEKFEPHPEQVEELTRLFESLCLQGVTSTIKEINRNSLVRWTNNRVKDIFETKYPLGFMYSQIKVDGKMQFDKYIENYYPQIISYELFEKARQAMQSRKVNRRVGRVSVDNTNIFRHTAFCSMCGESIFFMNNFGSNTTRRFYMSCRSNFEQTEKCSNRFRYDFAVSILFQIISYTTFFTKAEKEGNLESVQEGLNVINELIGKKPTHKKIEELGNDYNLAVQFSKIMRGSSETKSYNVERHTVENELHKLNVRLENLTKSVESIESGIIPAVILKQLESTELQISIAKEKLEALTVNSVSIKTNLNIETLDEFIKLFKTSEGRLQIINFLVTNGIRFMFDYDKETKVMQTSVQIDKKTVSVFDTPYKQECLERYGFGNLGDEFKLPDA